MGDFWNDVAINKIDEIWESYKANNFNILECFDFESAVTLSEESILAHLKRFLQNAPEETLALVLHLCTGCSTIDKSKKKDYICKSGQQKIPIYLQNLASKFYTYLNELKLSVGLNCCGKIPYETLSTGLWRINFGAFGLCLMVDSVYSLLRNCYFNGTC